MSFIHQLQADLVDEQRPLSGILLRMRLLANYLRDDFFTDWVRHEVDGYPQDVDVPSYRIAHPTYKGSWAGPLGQWLPDRPIPPFLIWKYAGSEWVQQPLRESISYIEQTLLTADRSSSPSELIADASDLIIPLQGKVYPGYACHGIFSYLPRATYSDVLYSIRHRLLDLTAALMDTHASVGDLELSSIQRISEFVSGDSLQTIVRATFAAATRRDGSAAIKEDLRTSLRGTGVSDEDINGIVDTLDELLSAPSGNEEIRQKVSVWLRELETKLSTASQNVIVKVLSRFFGDFF